MIGDNLETDIKFGNINSIDSLLVLSGCTPLSRINQIVKNDSGRRDEEGVPTYVQPFLNYTQ